MKLSQVFFYGAMGIVAATAIWLFLLMYMVPLKALLWMLAIIGVVFCAGGITFIFFIRHVGDKLTNKEDEL